MVVFQTSLKVRYNATYHIGRHKSSTQCHPHLLAQTQPTRRCPHPALIAALCPEPMPHALPCALLYPLPCTLPCALAARALFPECPVPCPSTAHRHVLPAGSVPCSALCPMLYPTLNPKTLKPLNLHSLFTQLFTGPCPCPIHSAIHWPMPLPCPAPWPLPCPAPALPRPAPRPGPRHACSVVASAAATTSASLQAGTASSCLSRRLDSGPRPRCRDTTCSSRGSKGALEQALSLGEKQPAATGPAARGLYCLHAGSTPTLRRGLPCRGSAWKPDR